MNWRKKFLGLVGTGLVTLAVLLSGCGGSGVSIDELRSEYAPPTRMPYTWVTVVYDASLVLDVWDPDEAASTAAQIAYENGGYLESARSWFDGGDKHVIVVLVVPGPGFDTVYSQVRGLGKVITEQIDGEAESYREPDGDTRFSHITLEFHPRGFAFNIPSPNLNEWRPLRTFQRAFRVFAAIFGFLVDMVIWVLVLIGPFAALWLGGRWWLRRYVQKTGSKQDGE